MSLTSQFLLNYYELQRQITYNIINMTILYINNSEHVSVIYQCNTQNKNWAKILNECLITK